MLTKFCDIILRSSKVMVNSFWVTVFLYLHSVYLYCRDRDSCPMENQCLTPKVIYRADVSNNKDNETKFYYVLTETSFNKRYGNHKRSFIHEQHKNDTELSKYIWDLTILHKFPTIKWCIVRKIHENAKSVFCYV